MPQKTGWIVRSEAGHDKGKTLCVVGREGERFLLLADGKTRKLAAPKKKQRGHVTALDTEGFAHPVLQKIQCGQGVSDREIRQMLAAFRDEREAERSGERRYD